ncbi:site-specific integrase [Kaistella yonginensis]|uniref:site-specific integrase n=1 Tax=Kaistella yonginensis TaxID=658267 RepID=UPI0025B32951|nr:site-specific integrase [Kaistella yonginensis]MDN3605859.1 site-specific integrase [Kaistella yonginensis]
MASLKFVLKTQQLDKAGNCSLYIRLIKDRKTKFISTGVKLKPNQWDGDSQKVRKCYPNSTRMNAVLAVKIADATMMVLEEEKKTQNITAQQIKQALKGEDRINFFDYQQKTFNRLRNTLAAATMYNYESLIKKFKEFIGHDDLTLNDITVSLLKDYINFLTVVKKNSNISIKTCLIPLAKIFNSAIEDGIIDKNIYPFDKIKIRTNAHKRNFLSLEQFENFKNYNKERKCKVKLCQDMFIFAVSAGGLRFSDVATLRWEEVDMEKGIIERKISKSGRVHRIKIGATAAEVLLKYYSNNVEKQAFIFPIILRGKFDLGNPEFKRKKIASANVICNLHLRKIGQELKFPFQLHFHLSRHTFATQALSRGMRIEYVSKLMDHSKISTTQIYAKVIDDDLDKAVDQYVM